MAYEVAAYFPDAIPSPLDEEESIKRHPTSRASCLPIQAQESETDEKVLERVARGSREALAVLFGRHGRAVFNTALRILRDTSEADDIRQEVFLYLFQKAKYFDPEKGSAVSWIIQITYHRAIDRRRYLTSRQHYKQEGVTEDRLPTSQNLPSAETIDGKALLNRMREDLSADQQMTLDLHFFEGYTFREIAEKNGQTVGNVRHHYYRALERLRSGLFPEKRA